MVGKLNCSIFIQLPSDVKSEFAKVFSIPRNGKTHVVDNSIKEDGYLNPDLEKIDVPVLQKYLGSDKTDFFVLYTEVVDQLTNKLHPPKVVEPVKEVNEMTIKVEGDTIRVTTPKKVGSKTTTKHNAESNE